MPKRRSAKQQHLASNSSNGHATCGVGAGSCSSLLPSGWVVEEIQRCRRRTIAIYFTRWRDVLERGSCQGAYLVIQNDGGDWADNDFWGWWLCHWWFGIGVLSYNQETQKNPRIAWRRPWRRAKSPPELPLLHGIACLEQIYDCSKHLQVLQLRGMQSLACTCAGGDIWLGWWCKSWVHVQWVRSRVSPIWFFYVCLWLSPACRITGCCTGIPTYRPYPLGLS